MRIPSNWTRNKNYWKGVRGTVCWDTGNESVIMSKKDDEQSPYHGMWRVEYLTYAKKGNEYHQTKSRARTAAIRHMKTVW